MEKIIYRATVNEIDTNLKRLRLNVKSFFRQESSFLLVDKDLINKSNYSFSDFKLKDKVVLFATLHLESNRYVKVNSIKKYRKKPYRPFEKFKISTYKL